MNGTFDLGKLLDSYSDVVLTHYREVKEFAQQVVDIMGLYFGAPVYVVNAYGPLDQRFKAEITDEVFNWPNPIGLTSPKVGIAVQYGDEAYVRFPVEISFDLNTGLYVIRFDAQYGDTYNVHEISNFAKAFYERVEGIVTDDLKKRQSDSGELYRMRGYF